MTNPINNSINKSALTQNTGKPAGKVDNAAKESGDSKTAPNTNANTGTQSNPSDKVSLTGFTQKLQQLEKGLANQPQVDLHKVEHIRQMIESNQYEINPERIAEKLTDLEKLLK